MNYTVEYYRGTGILNFYLYNFIYLRYTRTANKVGSLTIKFVSEPKNLVYGDYLIVYRNGQNDSRTLWFVHKISYDIVNKTYTLECFDANYLLGTRIVAYSAGTPQSTKNDYPINMIYEIIDENFNNPSDTDRTLLLDVGSNNPVGQTITKSFSRRNVLNTIQNICDEISKDIRLYFDVSYEGGRLVFRVYQDTLGSVKGLVLGAKYGNLEELTITEDYSQAISVAYVGGKDIGVNRQIAEVERPVRASSPYTRIERFVNAYFYETISGLTTEGNSYLYENRSKTTVFARLKDTAQTRYGIDWAFGDQVKVEVNDKLYTTNIDAVQVRQDSNSEDIDAYLSVIL